jgi:hypothetical protein
MMNDCDVTIELDGDPRLEGGDTVTGTVLVEVTDDCTCNALTAELGWYTDGCGNDASEIVVREELFHGEWNKDEEHRYPFEIDVPPGPYTYDGNMLSLDWKLEANADISWALDPSDARDVVVEPGGSAEDYQVGETEGSETWTKDGGSDNLGMIIGLLFSAILLSVAAWFGWTALSREGWNAFVSVVALGFLGGGLWVAYIAVRNYFAEMKLGDVQVTQEPERASPGDELACTVRLEPPREVDLNKIELRLHGFEEVVSGHGDQQKTHTHTIYEKTSVLIGSEQATVDGVEEFEGALTLPEDVPYSIEIAANKVRWKVDVSVDIPGWPDWELPKPFLVRPPVDDGDGDDGDAKEKGEEVRW